MIKLSKISTSAPQSANKEKIEIETAKLVKEIGEMVEIMYAQRKYSLLVVLQGMDASGKDGAFKNVFANTMQACVEYISYKKPTEEEFAHDFLWRIHKNAPAKGMVQGFIRSHYEDILIQRVNNWIDDKRVANRMKAINAFESLLESENNTKVLKFMMHISPEVQLEKLAERIEDPTKNWKHKDGDWKERELWAEYMKAYEYAINNSEIPWHIIPVDSRWYRDYSIAKEVHAALKKMELAYPTLPADSPAHALLASTKKNASNGNEEEKKKATVRVGENYANKKDKKNNKKSDKKDQKKQNKKQDKHSLIKAELQAGKNIQNSLAEIKDSTQGIANTEKVATKKAIVKKVVTKKVASKKAVAKKNVIKKIAAKKSIPNKAVTKKSNIKKGK